MKIASTKNDINRELKQLDNNPKLLSEEISYSLYEVMFYNEDFDTSPTANPNFRKQVERKIKNLLDMKNILGSTEYCVVDRIVYSSKFEKLYLQDVPEEFRDMIDIKIYPSVFGSFKVPLSFSSGYEHHRDREDFLKVLIRTNIRFNTIY